MAPKHTAIFPYHVSHARSVVPFNGWEMPLLFTGIVKEHRAVRSAAGLFDVSHMSKFAISGRRETREELQKIMSSVLPTNSGSFRYTHILAPSGGVIDDVVIGVLEPNHWLLISNAGTHGQINAWLEERLPTGSLTDLTSAMVCLAVQGPDSPRILDGLGLSEHRRLERFEGSLDSVPEGPQPRSPPEMKGWPSFRQQMGLPRGEGPWELYVTRTGYTGETGYEIVAPNELGWAIWNDLIDNGVPAAGLGARDTLRLEKGYLLSGQDFDGSQTPLELGYSWLIDWEHEFVGRKALLEQRERGLSQRFLGVKVEGKGVPRRGNTLHLEGEQVGSLTSATHSPSLGVGIGLGYLRSDIKRGDQLTLTLRERTVEAEVVKLPFL